MQKAANNIIRVYKHNYLEIICKELCLWPGTTSSDTYSLETMNPKEISRNRISYMKSLDSNNLVDKFPCFYWTPKLHKTPCKHRVIASSFNCTTKPFSVLFTLSKLSSVIYSHTGTNEMWILKNSSELLKKMNPNITSIQTFDF